MFALGHKITRPASLHQVHKRSRRDKENIPPEEDSKDSPGASRLATSASCPGILGASRPDSASRPDVLSANRSDQPGASCPDVLSARHSNNPGTSRPDVLSAKRSDNHGTSHFATGTSRPNNSSVNRSHLNKTPDTGKHGPTKHLQPASAVVETQHQRPQRSDRPRTPGNIHGQISSSPTKVSGQSILVSSDEDEESLKDIVIWHRIPNPVSPLAGSPHRQQATVGTQTSPGRRRSIGCQVTPHPPVRTSTSSQTPAKGGPFDPRDRDPNFPCRFAHAASLTKSRRERRR